MRRKLAVKIRTSRKKLAQLSVGGGLGGGGGGIKNSNTVN